MKFSELNPLMGVSVIKGLHQLAYMCPVCHQQTAILVALNGKSDYARRVWSLKTCDDFAWDGCTIEPSIQQHPVSRKSPPCPAHIMVTKGEVTFH
jgi:hypothetical protein